MDEIIEWGVFRRPRKGLDRLWDGWFKDVNFASQIACLREREAWEAGDDSSWVVMTRRQWKRIRRRAL